MIGRKETETCPRKSVPFEVKNAFGFWVKWFHHQKTEKQLVWVPLILYLHPVLGEHFQKVSRKGTVTPRSLCLASLFLYKKNKYFHMD